MEYLVSDNLNICEGKDPRIIVVCDTTSDKLHDSGKVMSQPQMNVFGKYAKDNGWSMDDFVFLSCAPPIPDDIGSSEKKIGMHLAEYRDEMLDVMKDYVGDADCIITLGKNALRQLKGRAVKITTARGSFTNCDTFPDVPVMPTISPANVLRRPETATTFKADLGQVGALADHEWDMEELQDSMVDFRYEWCLDIQDLIDNPRKALVVDTETTGLEWFRGTEILVAQISYKVGHTLLLPLHKDYWNDPALIGKSSKNLPRHTDESLEKLWAQLKQVLENPNTQVAGHNFKFDMHAFLNHGIRVANWYHDSMQLSYVVDDNMQMRGLDECVRLYVPEMAGYADQFNATVDKGNMRGVPHDKMLPYAGGDTDACLRLLKVMIPMAKSDKRNYSNYVYVQMPSLRTFVDMERSGILIDQEELFNLQVLLEQTEKEHLTEILREAARDCPEVMKDHEEEGWSLSRDRFVCDLLFSKKGLGLKPKVFTKGTAKEKNPADRIPSVSGKTHLPFFDHVPMVQKLMAYGKLQKMRTTYVGKRAEDKMTEIRPVKSGKSWLKRWTPIMEKLGIEPFKPDEPLKAFPRRLIGYETFPLPDGTCVKKKGNIVIHVSRTNPTGFWQYLSDDGKIHSTMRMDKTNTGRSASQNPNTQNFPKRGALAKQYRKIFVAPEGWMFTSCDLSQAELRIAAWMSGDKNMLEIYKRDGDIHSATAAGIIGISYEDFAEGMEDTTPLMEVANQWKGSGEYLRTFGNNEREKITVADFCGFKRFQAKPVNFGFLYGMWWTKFKDFAKTDYSIEFTDAEAEAIREDFFETYPSLQKYHDVMKSFARKNGYVRALHGALRRLPSVNSDDESIQKDSERQAINSPVQKMASDLALLGMNRFFRDCPRGMAHPALFIHDDCTIMHRVEHAEEMAKALKFYMETPPLHVFDLESPIPMKSDPSQGTRLDNLKELKGVVAEAPEWYDAEADDMGRLG